MPNALSDSIRLYGTDEPVEPPRILRAGPLSLEFEAGNLRYIRYRDHEMIRAVSFVVRDKNWATYAPQIRNLDIQEEPGWFRISYEANVGGEEQAFRYAAVIEGESDGSLRFSAKGAPSIRLPDKSHWLCRASPHPGRRRRSMRRRTRRWYDGRDEFPAFNQSGPADERVKSNHARISAGLESYLQNGR